MQTELADFIRDTPEGREADAILRKCVHCGFCTATCPTYQLLGDELDGPRGRIYLIKQALEGAPVTAKTHLHLDRCLTCRACETTCPSGVQYGRLVDIGRARRRGAGAARRLGAAAARRARASRCRGPALFAALLRLGQRVPLPAAGAWCPRRAPPPATGPPPRHARRMLVLAGCVQPALAPRINAAAARVLDRARHLADRGAGRRLLRRAALSPQRPGGGARRHARADRRLVAACRARRGEAIVMTASGCGVDGEGVRPPARAAIRPTATRRRASRR